MAREISRAESWETTYRAFQEINFSAFDYQTVKQSLLDYLKDYYPEQFNDFIESSEYIALIETFAYICEVLAYRIDMNAHENFISVAQRKQSVLRLAKLVSYNASRNMPGRGLVKITSVTTSETVYDSRGTNLSNTRIYWADTNNANWKEQFLLVMNQILSQEFGSVIPSERIQVDNILFELYNLKNNPLSNGVIPYTAIAGGTSLPMELVPSGLNEYGPYERRPSNSDTLTILYGSDGISDASDTSGFFLFTKQGKLAKKRTSYDGITPNQVTNIGVPNINEIDIWINNIDLETGGTISTVSVDDVGAVIGISGEWQQVDSRNAFNLLFNTNNVRNKYEIETLEDDKINIIFGDGDFSDIPSGSFDIWYRTSINDNIVIPKTSVNNKSASLSYQDEVNQTQNFRFTYSLINTITNATASEDIESVRKNAPSVYYTQDRMVNAQDYNTFLLQDSSVLKLRAFNRTYSGDSSYLAWNDPSAHYSNVKLFGSDLAVYYSESTETINIPNATSIDRAVLNYIQPYLTHAGVIYHNVINGMGTPSRTFSPSERTAISAAIVAAEQALSGFPVQLVYVPSSHNGMQGIDFNGTLNYDTVVSPDFGIVTNMLATIFVDAGSVNASDILLGYKYNGLVGTPALGRIVDPYTPAGLAAPVLYPITTIGELIDDITAVLGLNAIEATVAINGGNIVFKSNSTRVQSTITIDDVNLFKYLQTSTAPNAVTPTIPGTASAVWRPYIADTVFPSTLVPTFFITVNAGAWDVSFSSQQLLCESPTTKFWFTNGNSQAINGDTLQPSYDSITLLQSNVNRDRTGILTEDYPLDVVGSVDSTVSINTGLPDITKLSVVSKQATNNIDLDQSLLVDLLDPHYEYDASNATIAPSGDEINMSLVNPVGTSIAYTFDNTSPVLPSTDKWFFGVGAVDATINLSNGVRAAFDVVSPTITKVGDRIIVGVIEGSLTTNVINQRITNNISSILTGLTTAIPDSLYVEAVVTSIAPTTYTLNIWYRPGTDTPNVATIANVSNFSILTTTIVVGAKGGVTVSAYTDGVLALTLTGVSSPITLSGCDTFTTFRPFVALGSNLLNGSPYSAPGPVSCTLNLSPVNPLLCYPLTSLVSGTAISGVIQMPVTTHSYLTGYDELYIYSNHLERNLIKDTEYYEGVVPGSFEEDTNYVYLVGSHNSEDLIFIKRDLIYFSRVDVDSDWVITDPTLAIKQAIVAGSNLYKVVRGRDGYNFLWMHTSPRFNLIDPSTTNIVDLYVLPRGYYTDVTAWLYGATSIKPTPPTPFQLRVDYGYLLQSGMISDTTILHPGIIKPIFGSKALPSLQSVIKVVKDPHATMTNNEIKVKIVSIVRRFFDINRWEFGETFNFSELSATIHYQLVGQVNSVVMVPTNDTNQFGDLYQVFAREDEIIQPDISVADIEFIDYINAQTLNR